HRTFHGRGVRVRRPYCRHGARPVDRQRRRQDDPRRPAGAAGLFRQRTNVRAGGDGFMSSSPALAVEHLNAWYGAAQVLYDVTFTVGHGEVVALMGRNGAGKSTTMKAVMGLLPRRSGTVRFN